MAEIYVGLLLKNTQTERVFTPDKNKKITAAVSTSRTSQKKSKREEKKQGNFDRSSNNRGPQLRAKTAPPLSTTYAQ